MTDYTDLKRRLLEGRTTGSNLRWTVTPIHREAAAAIVALEAERDALCGLLSAAQSAMPADKRAYRGLRSQIAAALTAPTPQAPDAQENPRNPPMQG